MYLIIKLVPQYAFAVSFDLIIPWYI